MSEPITQVIAGPCTHQIRGHVDREAAVAEVRARVERDLAKAREALAALDRGDETVWHQRGVHVARNRREVPRPARCPSVTSAPVDWQCTLPVGHDGWHEHGDHGWSDTGAAPEPYPARPAQPAEERVTDLVAALEDSVREAKEARRRHPQPAPDPESEAP